jgi:sterol 3beta-glucosyltransferase
MKIVMVTAGSRGDADPVIALAAGLTEFGHDVHVVSNSDHRTRCASHSLPFHDLGFRAADLLTSAQGHDMLSAASAYRSRKILIDLAAQTTRMAYPIFLKACEGAHAILSNESVDLLSRSVGEHLSVPHVALALVPYGTTSVYRSFYADAAHLAELSNRATHELILSEHIQGLLPCVNEIRIRDLGLSPWTLDTAFRLREEAFSILGYSPSVFPAPHDWPLPREVTGYWSAPHSFEPPADLVAFLDGGPPPAYVGFGSMPCKIASLHALLEEVAEQTGQRFVISTGWNSTPTRTSSTRTIHCIGDVPHSWLFQRASFAIHHGGAGTTGASIRAGIPTLISWFMMDQPFWAQRVQELGVGLDLGHNSTLTVEKLCRAIEIAQSGALRSAARLLGERVDSERGIERATKAVLRAIRAQGGMV